MATFDIAEAIRNTNMYELAQKTNSGVALSEDDALVVAQLDEHFKEIGRTGHDKDHEIASFITKVVNEEFSNTTDDILDRIFDRGTIGANDDFEMVVDPENTLVAHEAAFGGNVPKSYVDTTVMNPKWKNRQIESEITYADLERNGWKSVAKLTEYAIAAFRNAMFADIFADLDAAIAAGADNYITVGAATMTQAAADAVALYVNDWDEGDGVILGYAKYIQQISKLTGYNSNSMLDDINRYGRLAMYDGVDLYPISQVRKQGDGTGLFIDKRVFGVAGKIGVLNQRGEVKVYETPNNNEEKIHLKFANFTYGWAFSDEAAKKVIKAVLQ